MAKDPAFLFYSQDFIVGVQTMSWEDRGRYITILAQMHQQGRMNEETIRFLVGSISDNLKSKFSIDDNGMWFNSRLEHETEKRNHFTETRRLNGNLGGRPKKDKPIAKPLGKPTNNHKGNLMGNENENEDRINSNIGVHKKMDFFLEVKNTGADIYTDEMLKRFSEYWTEPIVKGKDAGKERWQGEKTWKLTIRLSKWAERNLDGIVCYRDDDKSVKDKKLAFKEQLKPFLETYGKDLMNAFYLHWSQPENVKHPKRLKWELETSWELKNRIASWKVREESKVDPAKKEEKLYINP